MACLCMRARTMPRGSLSIAFHVDQQIRCQVRRVTSAAGAGGSCWAATALLWRAVVRSPRLIRLIRLPRSTRSTRSSVYLVRPLVWFAGSRTVDVLSVRGQLSCKGWPPIGGAPGLARAIYPRRIDHRAASDQQDLLVRSGSVAAHIVPCAACRNGPDTAARLLRCSGVPAATPGLLAISAAGGSIPS
jgi:hypothetical protein